MDEGNGMEKRWNGRKKSGCKVMDAAGWMNGCEDGCRRMKTVDELVTESLAAAKGSLQRTHGQYTS